MCNIVGYCCSFIFYAAATVACFGLKMYVECHGSWKGDHCALSECEQSYEWLDLFGSLALIGPVISALKFRCGFSWWRVLSLAIAIAITAGQLLSLWGCCFIRKRGRKDTDKKSKKKRKEERDEKKEALNADNTECEV